MKRKSTNFGNLMPTKLLVISVTITAGIFFGWLFVDAQTWQMSGSPPPDNASLSASQSSGGDNLGQFDHTASKTLDINDHKITSIVGSSNNTAFDVVAAAGLGVWFGSINNYALEAINSAPGVATLLFQNLGTGPGLAVISNNIALQSQKSVQAVNGVQFNDARNILATTAATDVALGSLYWGNQKLCEGGTDCGLAISGGDGLGNHVATKELDMNNFRIYGVASAEAGKNPLTATSTDLRYTARFIATNNHGVYSYTTSPLNISYGLSAIQTGSGYAVIASSTLGKAASFTGDIHLTSDLNSGVTTRPQIQFGADNSNTIYAGSPGPSAPTENLYWGDQLLCDISQPNCSVGSSITLATLWLDNIQGIHWPASGLKAVNIGQSDHDLDQLFIGHYWDNTNDGSYKLGFYEPAATKDMQAVTVVNKTAYIPASNGLTILDVSDATNPIFVSEITLGTAANIAQDVEVIWPYAYVATREAFFIVDVSNPGSPELADSLATIASADAGWNNQYWTGVELSGQYAYVFSSNTGSNGTVRVLDISNPHDLRQIGSFALADSPADMDLAGNDLVFASWNQNNNSGRIDWYDVSNPVSPTLLKFESSGASKPSKAIDIEGDYIYVISDKIVKFRLNRAGPSIDLIQDSADTYFQTVLDAPHLGGLVAAGSYVYSVGSASNGAAFPIFYTGSDLAQYPTASLGNQLISGGAGLQPNRFYLSGTTAYLPHDDASSANIFEVVNMQGLVASTANATQVSSSEVNVNGNLSSKSGTFGSLNVGSRGVKTDGDVTISSGVLLIGSQSLTVSQLQQLKAK